MRLAIRTLQRVAIFGLGVLSVWLIVDVFELVDRKLPWVLALSVTYGVGAYLILPSVVRMGLKILQHQRVPTFTVTGDGLPGNQVDVALAGTFGQLRAAFATAGWMGAERLRPGKFVADGQVFCAEHFLPDSPFQHSLSLWPRPRHRFPKGN